jgi:hypothetical protein
MKLPISSRSSFAAVLLFCCFSKGQCQQAVLANLQANSKEFRLWTSSFENFDISDFARSGDKEFEDIPQQNFDSLNLFLKIYKPLVSFNGQKNKFIDIYSYQLNLTKAGERYVANLNVGQAVYLCDYKTKDWKRIFYTEPGSINDVFWLDGNNFLLVLTINNQDEDVPVLYFGNTEKRSFDTFSDKNARCHQKKDYRSEKLKRIKIQGL